MKNYTLFLVSILFLFNAQSLNAQCEVDAGEDQVVCGTALDLNASLDPGDYDVFWSTTSSDVEFSDINSSTSQLELTGSYSTDNIYTCDLTWTITNSDGLTCSDVVNVTFKQVPSCDFVVWTPTCLGVFVNVVYLNENNPEMQCPSVSNWTLDDELVLQETDDPCIIKATSYNYSSTVENYPISLQVEQNGCVSELCEDYITVFSESNRSCSENLSINPLNNSAVCGLEFTLNAELSESANHGQWIFLTGPEIEFINDDAGTETEPGNPNAIITVLEPGSVKLLWKEWTGDYYIQEDVIITFSDPVYCNGLYLETELTMPSSEEEADGSIDITPVG